MSLAATLSALKPLADANDWSERERAGFALRDLMEEHFEEVFARTAGWPHDPSERIRRASCLACMQRKRFTTPARLGPLMARLEILMGDDSLYVRKCCGPFVVGYLAYTYPQAVLPWLETCASHPEANVRANVAKAYTQALGGQQPWSALTVLARLCHDPNRRVQSAVQAALRNVARRQPSLAEEVRRLTT